MPGDGPIVGNFGRACVRLAGVAGSEVVWVERLCPTRARVINIPFDTSRRYGEIVVHDGEPKGDRVVGDQLLDTWQASITGTWTDLHNAR